MVKYSISHSERVPVRILAELVHAENQIDGELNNHSAQDREIQDHFKPLSWNGKSSSNVLMGRELD